MNTREYTDDIDLQKYWLMLKRRWLPASLVLVSAVLAAGTYSLIRTPAYEASGGLIFATSATTSLTGVGENLGRLETVMLANNPLDTQAEVLTSNALVGQVIDELRLTDELGDPLSPEDFKRNLSVRAVPGTDILRVSFQNKSAEQAALIVNQLMANYIAYDIRTNRADAAAAREFIEAELPVAEQTVSQAAEQLRQFKDRNSILNLQDEARAAVENLGVLDNQIGQIRAELAAAQSRTVELAGQLELGVPLSLMVNTLTQTQGVQQSLNALQGVQAELSQQLARYTEVHPTIVNLRAQEAAASERLQEQVLQSLGEPMDLRPNQLQLSTLQQQLVGQWVESDVNRLSLNSRLASLMDTRNRYLEWSLTFPDLEKEQQQLVKRLSAAESNYERLLLRQQEIQLAENQTVGNARILDPADVPETSMGSGSKLFLAAGLVGGVLAGIATASLLDLIDRSVKTVKEAQAIFGLPVLGVIPKYRLPSPDIEDDLLSPVQVPLALPQASQYPIVSDAYQMLQANLKFVSSDKRLKTFVVASAVGQEGKTSVAAQLAISISQSGRKVLLIEADMRSPQQHGVWDVINGIGLSHVLVGEGRLDQALQSVAPNLTLMTAGVQPPNPLALIDSEQMAKLLEQMAQQYDRVVIDTPPLVNSAEAAILGPMADGVVLVVRPRRLDSASATAAKSLLDRSNATVLGLVANGIDLNTDHEDYPVSPALKMGSPGRVKWSALRLGKQRQSV